MAFCKTFTYNGRSLTDVYDDLMVVSFDFSGGSESQILARTVNRSPLTYDESIAYDYGAVDNEVFTFTLTIARKDAPYMTQNRVRNLVSWLMSPTEPQWLSMEICEYDDPLFVSSDGVETRSVYRNVDFKGRFVNASYAESAGYYKGAITFTFENISPYGFTPVQNYYLNHTVRESTTYTVVDQEHGCPGTFVGKLVSPIVLIRSLADKEDDVIELQGRSDDITDETSSHNPIALEEHTQLDPHQTITIYNGVANTGTFKIRIPNGTCVAIMDDNCYYYNAGNDNPNVNYITTSFDPANITGLYNFENIDNFNWPKMTSGTNTIRVGGIAKVQFFVRFYEALGV